MNLKTGVLEVHRRSDFITKMVRQRYRPDAQCPLFRNFLNRILPGLDDYMQRAAGYSLTGHTSEKVVFVCHGVGNNGKTTLLSLLRDLLGDDYAVLLQIDTLMVRQESNNTQADLADLRGARFVMTSETEAGQRLAEGKLKRISQGMGKIKATRTYENPIEFRETHKLWLDCNHKPLVRGTDNAIWNRLHLIPHEVTIPAEEIDRGLTSKLMAEGILAWALAGAVRWYEEGLGRPDPVERAGRESRDESDHLGRFLADACVGVEYGTVKARGLYLAYRAWCDETGEHTLTETAFGNAMKERGHSKDHSRTGWLYTGIGLRSD
jgi:putative DNA primase/helicase